MKLSESGMEAGYQNLEWKPGYEAIRIWNGSLGTRLSESGTEAWV